MRVLVFLVVMAVVVWALFEVLQTDSRDIRRLNKPLWVLVIILGFLVGAVAWFLFGRPRTGVAHPGRQGAAPRVGRPTREYVSRPAPDDDPEFLLRLSQQAEQQRKLRLLEEGGDSGPHGKGSKDRDAKEPGKGSGEQGEGPEQGERPAS